MKLSKVKICGVTTVEQADLIAQSGADYIGIVFHPSSKRFVEISKAIDMVAAARESGAEPVAVFTEQNAEEMMRICQETKIKIAQLHGDNARKNYANLSADLSRIYVCEVDQLGNIQDELIENFSVINAQRDFLLFDSFQPGIGNAFSWESFLNFIKNKKKFFNPLISSKYFIAGGLNVENVAKAIKLFHPFALDVSSGVEESPGIKNMSLVKKFIKVVKSESIL